MRCLVVLLTACAPSFPANDPHDLIGSWLGVSLLQPHVTIGCDVGPPVATSLVIGPDGSYSSDGVVHSYTADSDEITLDGIVRTRYEVSSDRLMLDPVMMPNGLDGDGVAGTWGDDGQLVLHADGSVDGSAVQRLANPLAPPLFWEQDGDSVAVIGGDNISVCLFWLVLPGRALGGQLFVHL